jgi:hypothetical protein
MPQNRVDVAPRLAVAILQERTIVQQAAFLRLVSKAAVSVAGAQRSVILTTEWTNQVAAQQVYSQFSITAGQPLRRPATGLGNHGRALHQRDQGGELPTAGLHQQVQGILINQAILKAGQDQSAQGRWTIGIWPAITVAQGKVREHFAGGEIAPYCVKIIGEAQGVGKSENCRRARGDEGCCPITENALCSLQVHLIQALDDQKQTTLTSSFDLFDDPI